MENQVITGVTSYTLTIGGTAVTLTSTGEQLISILQGIQDAIKNDSVIIIQDGVRTISVAKGCCVVLDVEWTFGPFVSEAVCEPIPCVPFNA